MNPFVCAVDLEARTVGSEALGFALPGLCRADGRLEYLLEGPWAGAWVPAAGFNRPALAHHAGLLGLGNVRLTDRGDVARSLGLDAPGSDLELALMVFARRGARGIAELSGSFSLVIWDRRQHALFAARDALGRQPLLFQRRGRLLVLASHADCLEQGDLDLEFLAGFVAGAPPIGPRTAYRNVQRLEAGSWLAAAHGRIQVERYWSPDAFEPAAGPADEVEAARELRRLFRHAVSAEIDGQLAPWSHLSGGLDSSSVVGMASRLAQEGEVPSSLGGTVSVVDSLADGNETRFSDAVVRRWGLRNERLEDYWAWEMDEEGPPALAEPRHFLPFFARDRAMCRAVREGGGSVLLSGYGADQYLSGSFDFLADLVAARRLKEAAVALLDLAVTTRQSFWAVAWKHGIMPLRPAPAPTLAAGAPPWLRPHLAGSTAESVPPPPRGPGAFARQVAREVASAEGFLERGLFEEGLELRYPFLHRPLVEFGLRLPASLRVRPHCQKWILRQALGDLLPAEVRERTGKGGIGSRIVWSLEREGRLLRRLIADSHLAELGVIDREALASAYDQARKGLVPGVVGLFFTLSLETWLAIRSGWWQRHSASLSAGPRSGPVPTPRKESAHAAVC